LIYFPNGMGLKVSGFANNRALLKKETGLACIHKHIFKI
jgi:hypothetical protein